MSIHKSTDNPWRKVAGERFSRSKRETITNDISESEKLREAYRRERSFKATHFNRDIRKEFTEAAYCEQTFLAQPHFSRPSSFPPRAHTRLIAQLLPSRYLRLLARCSSLSLFSRHLSLAFTIFRCSRKLLFVSVDVFVHEPFICPLCSLTPDDPDDASQYERSGNTVQRTAWIVK